MFARPSEKHAGDGLLDFFIAVDTGGDGRVDLLHEFRIFAHNFELLLFYWSVINLCSFFCLIDPCHVDISLRQLIGLCFIN